MPIEAKDEYAALRGEVLARFGRIFDIAKVGPAGVVAVLAFQLANPNAIGPAPMLVLVQFFLITMTLVAINEFKHIYRIGTYIAVACEGDKVNGWTRMSRSLSSFLASEAYLVHGGDPTVIERNKRLFPWGERWGEDPSVFALLMGVLCGMAWTCSYLVTTPQTFDLLRSVLIPAAPTAGLAYLLYWLRAGIGTYREQTEIAWRLHFAAWRSKFPDPYATSTRADIDRSS